jgi:hypothetical protein
VYPRDELLAAARGLFVYDWNEKEQAYRSVARPAQPVTSHELADREMGLVSRRVPLEMSFLEETTVRR